MNSDNSSSLVPDDDLPASSASKDDRDSPFRNLAGIDNPIDDFGLLDDHQETYSEIINLPSPTPLVHQLPVIKNRTQVTSLPSCWVAAAKNNVVPNMWSPVNTRPKRRITTRKIADQASDDDECCGNLDCEDSLRYEEMVKCAGPSCHT